MKGDERSENVLVTHRSLALLFSLKRALYYTTTVDLIALRSTVACMHSSDTIIFFRP
jgi:hypothetical protein